VWSTDSTALDDPFQRRWYIRQALLYGKAEDIRQLDFAEVARLLDELRLPPYLENLWRDFLRKEGCFERKLRAL
jgi:hypothetical protein